MRGMTWDHPRGYDPLVAASVAWQKRGGTEILWERRSLQDFETFPVEDLARAYDLIVIDHPHVGIAVDQNCLLPIRGDLSDIANGSVGGSYESYTWHGRQWALPIDAAAQVQAWVPGRIAAPARDWLEVTRLAAAGRVALPLRPPHSLMSLMTLCGLGGVKLDASADMLFPHDARKAYALLAELADAVGPAAVEQDPIGALEAMATPASTIAISPLIYGYVSYSRLNFRPVRIAFADLAEQGHGPTGSVLGGTGIAVSAYAADKAEALAFARWLADGAVQGGLVAPHGGQPAHADAWRDEEVNATTRDFYRATRRTLDRAWVRPRRTGYMQFQHRASVLLNAALIAHQDAAETIAKLNALFLDQVRPSER